MVTLRAIATPMPLALLKRAGGDLASSAKSISPTSMDSIASQSSASEAIKSLSSVMSQASASLASESIVASGGETNPPVFKYVGIALAVGSGDVFIGSSFVFKKKGLLAAQKKYHSEAGESFAYLKSPMWWTGMTLMILGEILNFVAYAFTDAVLVTPLGALSVVICAILSSIFLKEKLTLFGKVGCFLCIVGATIIAINGPEQAADGRITEFQKLFLSVGFLVWAGVCIVTALLLVFVVAPKFGKKNMLVYITVCSIIGGLSVSVTSGLGAAILLSIRGQNQFKHWFIYFLLGFVVITLLVEIVFLNKALELFNTAMVTPTYYVLFTFSTLVTSIILFQGLHASTISIITIVLGFLVICSGITLLQLSKIDPDDLEAKNTLDRRSTMLLRASRSHLSPKEKGETTALEDPGVDTVRGGLGIVGSMIRARSSRRFSQHLHSSSDAYRTSALLSPTSARPGVGSTDEHGVLNTANRRDLERYQLSDDPSHAHATMPNLPTRRDTAISFVEGSDDPHGTRSPTFPTRNTEGTPNPSDPTAPRNREYALTSPPIRTQLAGVREASAEGGGRSWDGRDPLSPVVGGAGGGVGIAKVPQRDIKNMWNRGPSVAGGDPEPLPSPMSADGEYEDERDRSSDTSHTQSGKFNGGAGGLGSGATSPVQERSERYFPGGQSGKRDAKDEEEEEHRLLLGRR